MGAWGHLFDENDDAADWLADFSEEPSWQTCKDAFSNVDVEYVEAPEASMALAAAEIVAAGLGKPNRRLDSELAAWAVINAGGAHALNGIASTAVHRIQNDSELNELWKEADANEWHAANTDLLSRLS